MNVCTKYEVRILYRSWDNRGCPKIGGVNGYAHTPYFQKKSYRPPILTIPVCALVFPQFSIGVFGGGCQPPNQWKGRGAVGVWMVPSERALVSSYRPSIVTVPLCLRFCDPAYATFSPPTFSLSKISPRSSGSRWIPFGLWRAKVLG